MGDAPEHTWASDARIRSILRGLVSDIPWESRIGDLSGGQRRRVDLARVLVGDFDVLMLDEPTNHLDLHGIAWLAEHLKNRWPRRSGALLVVTHDRWFLDEVCLGMWEVHDGQVEQFEGGYSAYVLQRVERTEAAQTAEQKRRNLMRKELAWLSRGARARATKPKFHVEAARALIADEPPMRNALELKKTAMSRLGKQVVDLVDVTERFGETTVIDDVTWLIGPGDRFGILGENGSGKTTLLNLIVGSLEPTAGHVKIGKTVKFAVLTQHLDELSELEGCRVREVLSRYKTRYEIEGKELTPAQLLERLGFEAAQLSTPVSELSGGQKRRLQLMLILLDKPNVLILDEPDNDLDIDMLAVLESFLDTWPGTLLLITHDRHLMERVTDHQFALVDGKVRHVPGGVDEYLRLLDRRGDPQPKAKPGAPKAGGQRGARAHPQEGARVYRAQARDTLQEGRRHPRRDGGDRPCRLSGIAGRPSAAQGHGAADLTPRGHLAGTARQAPRPRRSSAVGREDCLGAADAIHRSRHDSACVASTLPAGVDAAQVRLQGVIAHHTHWGRRARLHPRQHCVGRCETAHAPIEHRYRLPQGCHSEVRQAQREIRVLDSKRIRRLHIARCRGSDTSQEVAHELSRRAEAPSTQLKRSVFPSTLKAYSRQGVVVFEVAAAGRSPERPRSRSNPRGRTDSCRS